LFQSVLQCLFHRLYRLFRLVQADRLLRLHQFLRLHLLVRRTLLLRLHLLVLQLPWLRLLLTVPVRRLRRLNPWDLLNR
jgi:hypothetical protein